MGESGPEADDLDAGDPFADTDAMERQSDDAADEVGAVSGRASTPSGAAVGESREPQEETTTSESGDNDGEGLQAPQTIPPGKRSPEAVAQLVVPDGVQHDPDGIPYALARSTATDDRKKAQVFIFDQTEKLLNTAHRERADCGLLRNPQYVFGS